MEEMQVNEIEEVVDTRFKSKKTFINYVDLALKILCMTTMILYAISLFIPLAWMLMSSLKNAQEYVLYPWQPPALGELAWENYSTMIEKFRLRVFNQTTGETYFYGPIDMIYYSFVWSLLGSAIGVLSTCFCAYIISKLKFPGRDFLYAFGLVFMLIPIYGTFAAAMRVHKAIGLYDNFWGRIFILTPMGTWFGFSFILFYGAWKGVPWEYAEAASIDGAGQLHIFLRVMLPMMVPLCVCEIVLGFLNRWNNYQDFLIWLPSWPNLALGIYLFQYEAALYEATMPVILAGFVLVSIPTSLLYLLSKSTIMKNLNVGGLKG